MIRFSLLVGWITFLAHFSSAYGKEGAQGLVTSVSSDVVSIQSNFTGAEIVIFGQVNSNEYQSFERARVDIAVVVEGPPQDITTRRKRRLFGVWVNLDAETFREVPSFYAVASTSKISEIAPRKVLEELGIGLNHINLPVSGASQVPLSDRDDFRQAFLRLRKDMGLYTGYENSVRFLSDRLFRTKISLPANIPVGDYKVKSYLFRNGEAISWTEQKLSVVKIGFEEVTFQLAKNYSLVYGILAVAIAILTGWFAGVIFRKD